MNPARREPLLWLQLLGLAALPLEALLLLLVLAGADPGPFPGIERVLAWALGALAPAVLFWRLPPDLCSLLLVQVPLRGRRPEQMRLSALQTALPLRVIAASGAALLLPLLWRLDAGAGLAWAWSPLSASPRLVVLLVSVPLLALMQWQWHQLIQALWLFTRPAALVDETLPLTQVQAAESRLNLGIPLLLLPPLAIEAPAPRAERTPEPQPEPEAESGSPTSAGGTDADAAANTATEPEPDADADADADANANANAKQSPVSVAEWSEADEGMPEVEETPTTQAAEATIAEVTTPTAADAAIEAAVEAVADEVIEAPVDVEADQPAPVEPQSEQAISADADGDAQADAYADLGDLIVDAGVAVSPEQSTEEHERSNLDP